MLNEEEHFLLIVSAWLHDVGYVIWSDLGDREYLFKSRKKIDSSLSSYYKAIEVSLLEGKDVHNKLSGLYVEKNMKYFSLVKTEAKALSEICALQEATYPSDLKPSTTIIKDQKVRVKLLASLLRLADELDIEFSLERILSPTNSLASLRINSETLEIMINVKTTAKEKIEQSIEETVSLAVEQANHVLSQHYLEPRFSYRVFFLELQDPPLATRVLAALTADVDLQNLIEYIENSENRLKNSIATRGRTIDSQPNMFVNFKRWNSTSPIHSPESKGGGYFLVWRHRGILVDPGYDYLDAFLVPFTLDDIDAVIVTHDHPDHSNDLPKILNLLHDLNEIKAQAGLGPKTIDFFVSSGVDNRYGDMLRSEPAATETVILPGRAIPLNRLGFQCQSTPTRHSEISGGSNGFGLRIRSIPDGRLDLGITGDTAYFNGLGRAFNGVKVLVAHIGRLRHPLTRGFSDKHLSFPGVVSLVSQLTVDPQLVIVGEFGEEMNGRRKAICDELEEHILNQGKRVRCIPADRKMLLMFGRNSLKVGRGFPCKSVANLQIVESEQTSKIYYD